MRLERPIPAVLALVAGLGALSTASGQGNDEIRDRREAILKVYPTADGEKRQRLAEELARLDYQLAASAPWDQGGTRSRSPSDTLSQLDAHDRTIRELEADVERLDDLAGSRSDEASAARVQLLHALADIETLRRQKMAIVATDPIGASLRSSLQARREEIVGILGSLIDRASGGSPGSGESMAGTGVEAELALEVPGTHIGIKGEAKGQVHLGRSGDALVVSNLLQGSVKGTLGLDAKVDGGAGFKGFGAEFELASGTEFEARALFQFDPDRPEDLVGVLGKIEPLLETGDAAALFTSVFSDEFLAGIGPAGASASSKRTALARLLADRLPSSWEEASRNSRESDRVSPSLALFAGKALEGLGGDAGTVEFDAAERDRLLRIVAEMEGRNDRNRKSRQMTFRLDANAKGAVKTPLFDQELAGGAGVALWGFEDRILPDGTRVQGTVSTRHWSLEGKAGAHTPMKAAVVGTEGSVGKQFSVTVKEFRDAAGKVRRVEVATRGVTSEGVALKGGLEGKVKGIGAKAEGSAAGAEVESVVDTFVLDDPTAEQVEDLESALDLAGSDLMLGDVDAFARIFEEDFFFDAEHQAGHTRTTTRQSTRAAKGKVEAGILEGKTSWVDTSATTSTETLFGSADRGDGAAVENLAGDVDGSDF